MYIGAQEIAVLIIVPVVLVGIFLFVKYMPNIARAAGRVVGSATKVEK